MNSNLETWRIQQYAANVMHLSQQKGSRLAQLVRNEQFIGKSEFFDTLGLATAQKKTGRNTDTPNLDLAHSRRKLTTSMYEWATLVDRKDKLQNIHNPDNEYSVAAQNAMGRSMDDILIQAALDVAYYGEDGTSTQVLPNTQKIASVTGSALDRFNLASMIAMKQKLDEAEVEGKRHLVLRAADLANLFADSKVTSADYNTIKALVRGELNEFMGFNIIRSERLPLASLYDADGAGFKYNYSASGVSLYDASGSPQSVGATDKVVVAFVGDGLILGKNEGMVARIDERNDKSYAHQVYASMDLGGVRMEEVKVVSCLVKA